MPNILDGVTFYSAEEGRQLGHEKIKRDAKQIAAGYKNPQKIAA